MAATYLLIQPQLYGRFLVGSVVIAHNDIGVHFFGYIFDHVQDILAILTNDDIQPQ